MKSKSKKLACSMLVLVAALVLPLALVLGDQNEDSWFQWAHDAEHSGRVLVRGQSLNHNLFNVVYDPLVPEEEIAGDGLLVHYQTPLVDEDSNVYMEFKSGTFDNVNFSFSTQTWSEKKLTLANGKTKVDWSYDTDWKAPGNLFDIWEPVFHAVINGPSIYLPGAGGSIWQLRAGNGAVVSRINPFGSTVDPTIFTVSPLTADDNGNIYYNAVQLSAANIPLYDADVVDSWLVKVSRKGTVSKVSYKTLVPGAPTSCLNVFSTSDLPWPPSPTAVPPSITCGTVRTALNAAPAIGPDGTIYTVARTHFTRRYGWIVAVNPNLTPKWASSLRGHLHDGCGVHASNGGLLPANGSPGGCRAGANFGVDPSTNQPGAGEIDDSSSASITVAPDGLLFGALSRYNYAQGHLMKFDFHGNFLVAFGFGWDITPAIYVHDRTYSIVIKNNHYGDVGSYCNIDSFCPPDRTANNPASPEQYFVSQLNPHLALEWSYQNTNTESCTRNPDNSVSCVSDHPAGFEWCVNAPVVDRAGIVYANSEDGNLYAINQGGSLKQLIFQQLAIGAAYTPMSIGPDGRLFSQNAGHLFVVGK